MPRSPRARSVPADPPRSPAPVAARAPLRAVADRAVARAASQTAGVKTALAANGRRRSTGSAGRLPPARRRANSQPALADLDTRARLLHVGQQLARAAGLRSITVRGLAQAASVNLGTFVYHFGTRDAFIAELIEDLYAPLYARLQAAAASKGPPLARVRELVLQLIEFVAGNAGFVLHVIADAAAGEPGARQFMQALARRHPALLLRAIGQAQSARVLPRSDPLHMMVFLMIGVAFPLVAATGLIRSGIVPRDFAAMARRLATDAVLARQRLDWALLGLQPRKDKR